MKRNEFRFLDRLRVRWAEIDAQKIVFNSHYLMYFDTAVAGYWRALALPYEQTMHALGGDIFVRKASLDYHASARFDDVLDVGVQCARVGTSSMVFSAAVFRQDQLLVSGELIYVFADPQAQSAKPVPPALRAVFEAFEAGHPMVDVRLGAWVDLGADARALRTEVFVNEQRVPAELEWDEADHSGLHAVAYNRVGAALATGRLLLRAPGVARIGRMAVSQAMRGSGVGRLVLDALMAAAAQRGEHTVMLNAQTSAASFYRRAGFVEQGEPFEEAGITHIEMTRRL
jgi:YbgC/YbaW family acyl-CoA thioester hydrolase